MLLTVFGAISKFDSSFLYLLFLNIVVVTGIGVDCCLNGAMFGVVTPADVAAAITAAAISLLMELLLLLLLLLIFIHKQN